MVAVLLQINPRWLWIDLDYDRNHDQWLGMEEEKILSWFKTPKMYILKSFLQKRIREHGQLISYPTPSALFI